MRINGKPYPRVPDTGELVSVIDFDLFTLPPIDWPSSTLPPSTDSPSLSPGSSPGDFEPEPPPGTRRNGTGDGGDFNDVRQGGMDF